MPANSEDSQPDLSFVFLVDGDNAQASLIQPVLDEVTRRGRIHVRRVYGDWNSPNMLARRKTIHTRGLKSIWHSQTFVVI